MTDEPGPSTTDALLAARRELHELAVLSSALLRLATKVQARCDTLRHTLGGLGPLAEEEVDLHAPRRGDGAAGLAGQEPAAAPGGPVGDEDPAALLAISLAGQGLNREQIGGYLRDSFGMQGTDELLDRVLPGHA